VPVLELDEVLAARGPDSLTLAAASSEAAFVRVSRETWPLRVWAATRYKAPPASLRAGDEDTTP
jgi:hypothetical protein